MECRIYPPVGGMDRWYVRLESESYVQREQMKDAMSMWCYENFDEENMWSNINNYFIFMNKDDAMLFYVRFA